VKVLAVVVQFPTLLAATPVEEVQVIEVALPFL
jgi:hypothetical protein